GFNTQKNQGYHLEHRFSHDYQGMKNHYYLIQIGHMIAQIIEAWKMLWKKVKQSREQKHRLLLTAWKNRGLKESLRELEKKIQVRFA
ncbi:MAG TPA: transposase, partial [Candidatus Mediterraneibacter faecavium]|nr:transposase [Candidatus Mediterraneibacter faecavium]